MVGLEVSVIASLGSLRRDSSEAPNFKREADWMRLCVAVWRSGVGITRSECVGGCSKKLNYAGEWMTLTGTGARVSPVGQ